MKKASFLAAACALAISAYAQDFSILAGAGADSTAPNPLYPFAMATMTLDQGAFSVVAAFGFTMDGALGGWHEGQPSDYLALLFPLAGIAYDDGALALDFGVLPLEDVVGSPYSLFLSGLLNASLTFGVAWETDAFLFVNRWVALNWDSARRRYDVPGGVATALSNYPWPDRSANLKFFGLKLGKLVVGVQDAVVYSDIAFAAFDDGSPNPRGPAFDPLYFLIPVPSILVQGAIAMQGGPDEKYYNDNTVLGLWGEWTDDDWWAYAQLLVDDINMNAIIDPDGPQNPSKVSWSLGGRIETAVGSFGFFHAGASKYAFGPMGGTGINTEYGYVFAPDTLFDRNGAAAPIDPESNYLGYLHGENNLAFMLDWKGSLGPLDAFASLEFVLSGAKSPANPWHSWVRWYDGGQGTKMLDDPVLEKKLTLSFSATLPFEGWSITLFAVAGYAWNVLELVAPSGDETDTRVNGLWIWTPSARDQVFGAVELAVTLYL